MSLLYICVSLPVSYTGHRPAGLHVFKPSGAQYCPGKNGNFASLKQCLFFKKYEGKKESNKKVPGMGGHPEPPRYKLWSPGLQLLGCRTQTGHALQNQLPPRHCDNDGAETFDLHIQNQA